MSAVKRKNEFEDEKDFKFQKRERVNMSVKINPPDMNSAKCYESFKNELLLWSNLTSLEPEKQAGCVALNLPNDCSFAKDIRAKVMEKLSVKEMMSKEGLAKLIDILDEELMRPDIEQAVEDWDALETRFKKDSESIDEFITDFERIYKRVELKGAKLPPVVKTFMLLKRVSLSVEERLVVLSRLNFDKKEYLFDDLKKSLKLFKGVTMSHTQSSQSSIILKDSAQPEVLEAHFTNRGRGGFRGRGRGGASSGNWKQRQDRPKSGNWHQNSEQARKRSNSGGEQPSRPEKRINPSGADGNPKRCKSCDSIRHMLSECPDSWENMKGAYVSELETVGEHEGEQVQEWRAAEEKECWVTEEQGELKRFCVEAKNSAALDSCCTGIVCGEEWLQTFLASMSSEDRKLVKGPLRSDNIFRFGNKGSLKSRAKYRLPVSVANVDMFIETDVIESDIPMLLSKDSMKTMGMILNFVNDTVEIGGKIMNLSETSSGHYIIPLLRRNSQEIHVTVKLPESQLEQKKAVVKLHRQFAHPGKESFVKLLKESKLWTKQLVTIVDEVYDQCDTCKQTARCPSRPVVCMPVAREFNEVVTLDLKLWRNHIILHMIDMFTRYGISVIISDKKPETVARAILTHWISYFGRPTKGILNDNGGEFVGKALRDLKDRLDLRDITTGAESPFQNGMCERNHSVIDTMLLRLVIDFPKGDLQELLMWAGMARNSLQNVHGFSPNQLVFGRNPSLPNNGEASASMLSKVSTETVEYHLKALHKAREAFIESESSERIRRALLHKMRASEQKFQYGEEVYYKREGQEAWAGPGKVIFQDGKVVFIRHGAYYVRASVNKILKRREELGESRVEVKETSNNEKKVNEKKVKAVLDETLESTKEIEVTETEDNAIINLRRDDKIEVKSPDTGEWEQARVINRAVKLGTSRPDKNWFNLELSDKKSCMDLDRVSYKVIESQANLVMLTEILPRSEHNSDEALKAKLAEIEKLDSFYSYEVVEKRPGDKVLGHTWVVVRKDGKVRARLTAKGFQEEVAIRSDSPTVGKSTFRLILTVAVAEKWKVKTVDITSAFLQGSDMDRCVLVKPPKEAGLDKNKVWKLKKPLYGLNDASRKFYLKVNNIFTEIGCQRSKIDPALFYMQKNGKLEGLVAAHVDDFILTGSCGFNSLIMNGVNKSFKVGKVEEGNFRYTGFKVIQNEDGITVDQTEYISKVKISRTSEKKRKTDELDESELSMLRSNVGAIQWLARGTRPDVCFEGIDLSTRYNKATQHELNRSVKCLEKLKMEEEQCKVKIPRLGGMKGWILKVFSDASWGNRADGVNSTSGHVVFLTDKEESTPVSWESGKIHRVVNSTIAAEALAAKKAMEDAVYLREIIKEVLGWSVKIHVWVDHKGVVQSFNSTNNVEDKRLRIDIAAVRQMMERGEIDAVHHCQGKNQLADCLTKYGADGQKLLSCFNHGKLIDETN